MPYLSLTLNGYPVDLPADAAVALSYRANDLRNLDSREASFSETFTLPLTAQNVAVLGAPHSLDSLTTTPYRLLPAVLTSPGGVEVLNGFGIIELAHEGYDVTLTSSVVGLFTLVGNRSLRELDLSAFDHPLTYDGVAAHQGSAYPFPYCYPICDTGALTYRPTIEGLTCDEIPAAVRVHALLEAMLSDPLPPVPLPPGYVVPTNPLAGYRLTGSLLAEQAYQDMVLPRATAYPQLRESYLYPYRLKAVTDTARVYAAPNYSTQLQFPLVLAGSLFGGVLYRTPPHPMGFQGTLKLPVQRSAGFDFTIHVEAHDTTVPGAPTQLLYYADLAPNNNSPQTFNLNFSVPYLACGPATTISVRLVVIGNGSFTLLPGAAFTITPLPRALPGALVHLDAGLPDMGQADLLKLVFNQFDCIIQADPILKEIRLDLFNDLERNRDRAVDWTNKLDLTKRPRLSFRLGEYGQRNTLGYGGVPKQYEDELPLLPAPYDDEATGRAALLALNTTLPGAKEVFSTDLLLPLPHETVGGPLAWLPFFTEPSPLKPAVPWDSLREYKNDAELIWYRGQFWDCTVGDSHTTTNPPPSGQYYLQGDQEWELATGYTIANETLNSVARLLPYFGPVQVEEEGQHGAAFTPTWQLSREGAAFADLLPAYYEGLSRILERVQVLTLDVRLTALDVEALDFTVPVKVGPLDVPGYGRLDCLLYKNLIDQHVPSQPGSVPVTFVVLGEPVAGLAGAVPSPNGRAYATEDGLYYIITEDGNILLLEA